MVWEEIKRILTGMDEEVKRPPRGRAGEHDVETADELTPTLTEGVEILGGGVSIEPYPVKEGEAFTVTYDGLLAQQGAAGITLHCGYGYDQWTEIQDVPMHPVGYRKWQATLFPDRSGTLSFCFRDTAEHWDNNAGQNWSINIAPSSL